MKHFNEEKAAGMTKNDCECYHIVSAHLFFLNMAFWI